MVLSDDIGKFLDDDESVFQTYDVEHVDTFMRYLYVVVSPLFKNRGDRDSFIFRGQDNADWSLIPGAMREDEKLYKNLRKWVPIASQDFRYVDQNHQTECEWDAVSRFAAELEKAGQPWPGVPSALREPESFHSEANFNFNFPPEGTRELFAFAQHHGVPTRFLDWSQSHLHACYFAAYDAALRNREDSEN